RNRLGNPRLQEESDSAVRIPANDLNTIRTELEEIIRDLDGLLKN
ncbi:MAG: transcriptional regulator, partial [Alcaligenaceae bacterium]|nr:transcriptional regulator [Alcaligenaceae bacterium]